MCGNCVTNVDALVVSGLAATSTAACLAQRARALLGGRSSFSQKAAAYAANAGFLRSLGHDPALVLGPPPEGSPARSPRPVAAPAGALLGT